MVYILHSWLNIFKFTPIVCQNETFDKSLELYNVALILEWENLEVFISNNLLSISTVWYVEEIKMENIPLK